MLRFHTTSATLQGAICGELWWPNGALGGYSKHVNLRDRLDRFSDPEGATFREVLLAILAETGDFQNPRFTADTAIVVTRRTPTVNGRDERHVRELEIASLPDCADLVNPDTYSSDLYEE